MNTFEIVHERCRKPSVTQREAESNVSRSHDLEHSSDCGAMPSLEPSTCRFNIVEIDYERSPRSLNGPTRPRTQSIWV